MKEGKAVVKYEDMVPFQGGFQIYASGYTRMKSFRAHLKPEVIYDAEGELHIFDVIWFKTTGELIAAEVEEDLGTILPSHRRLRRYRGNYTHLGTFSEQEIDDLLLFEGSVIQYLWEHES